MTTDLERIETKLDRVSDTLSGQAVTLARNTVSLEDHVRRTNLLEARVEPLTVAHQRWVGAGKAFAVVGAVIGVLSSLVAVTEGVIHVIKHLH